MTMIFNLCSTDVRYEISFTVTTVLIANFFKIWNRQRSFIVRWSSWIVKSSRVIPFQDDELLKYSFTMDLRLSEEKISIINTLNSLMISSSYFANQFEIIWLLLHIQFRISNIFSLSDDVMILTDLILLQIMMTTTYDMIYLILNWYLCFLRIQLQKVTNIVDFIITFFF